ncbi:MAG: hypothetical protein O7A98_07140 [Acidobacteria bacterium]|nr:hypothetical protein [Acidobacteriota bacterium]
MLAVLVLGVLALPIVRGQVARAPSPSGNPRPFERIESEPSSPAELARMHLLSGNRELRRAGKLTRRLPRMNESKRPAAQARLQQAYDQATREFYTAIQLSPNLSEAYRGLGAVMLSQEYFKDALKIYADGLRIAPQDDDLFRGWTASLLALDMIDDTIHGYSTLAETNPRRARILMEQMRASLQTRLESPDGFDPSRTESLARWLAEQGG